MPDLYREVREKYCQLSNGERAKILAKLIHYKTIYIRGEMQNEFINRDNTTILNNQVHIMSGIIVKILNDESVAKEEIDYIINISCYDNEVDSISSENLMQWINNK